MRKLPIPKSFQIFGHTIQVGLDKTLGPDRGLRGRALLTQHKITIHDSVSNGEPESQAEQSLVHEVLEVLADKLSIKLGHNDLDRLAEGLTQVWKTAKF